MRVTHRQAGTDERMPAHSLQSCACSAQPRRVQVGLNWVSCLDRKKRHELPEKQVFGRLKMKWRFVIVHAFADHGTLQ